MEHIVIQGGGNPAETSCNVAYGLLMADCLGVGVTYRRRKELRNLRKAIVVHYPAGMSESVAMTKALQSLSERDFAANNKMYNEYQQYREFYTLVP